MQHTKKLGNEGENIITTWLKQKKFTIISKNYRTRWGEVDIIAKKDDIISFVEVKTRLTRYFPIASVVTKSKQKKLIRTAKTFIAKNNIIDKTFRFDIAVVVRQRNSFEIQYLPNAFTEQRHYS